MAPTPRENAALVRGSLTDVASGEDTDAAGAFVAEEVVDRHLVFGDGRGRESVTALRWRVLAAADVDVEDVVAMEDRAAVRGTVSGTHRESLVDLPPTGEPFEIASVWFCRIDDGRIAEIRSLPDGLGLVQQLGAVPDLSSNRGLTERTEQQ